MVTNGAIRFLVYAGLGIVVGGVVSLLEWATVQIVLNSVLNAPLIVQMIAPPAGLLFVAGILRVWPKVGSKTADAYVESFHCGTGAESKNLLPKLIASFATIGSGGAVGIEGPAILTGATIGQSLGDRLPKVLGERPRLVLLVAGAAAGIAAVFKAPATGVLFAMEVPYRRDISRHGLIPALIAAAASYLTFVSFLGATPLLRFDPTDLELQDEILAALTIGVLAGLVARLLAKGLRYAKALSTEHHLAVRLPIAAVTMASGIWLANELVDQPLTLGLGTDIAAELVRDNSVTLLVVVVLFILRALSTGVTIAVGGVGGVFIPLVVQGLLLGRAIELAVGAESTGLYPVIGLAAVLGAAYRTPLAAIMFVAESTGRAEFVIPALIATAISQSLMGEESVSNLQRTERQGQLERRLVEPASVVMLDDLGVIKPDETLLEIIDKYGGRGRSFAVPVAGPEYLGLMVLHDLAAAMLEFGPDATAREAMRELPAVQSDAPAVDAARLMNQYDTAAIAVVDENNCAVGVISTTSLAGLKSVDLGQPPNHS